MGFKSTIFSRVNTCQREYVTIIRIWEPEVLMHCLDRSTQEARQETCHVLKAILGYRMKPYLEKLTEGLKR